MPKTKEEWDALYAIAKNARCQGEEEAILWEDYEPGQADCGNCGHGFPPENIADTCKRVWCSNWGEEESVMYFCKAWKHPKNNAAGIAPKRAVPYTRERITDEQAAKERDDSMPRR